MLGVLHEAAVASELEGKDIEKYRNAGFTFYNPEIVTYEQNELGSSTYYKRCCVFPEGIYTKALEF